MFYTNKQARRTKFARTTMIACAAGIATAACSGCVGTGMSQDSSALTNSSSVVELKPFDAPSDPQMGQVVVTVSSVDVAAPTPSCIGDLGQAIRAQFINTLSMSSNFVVADREVLGDIASEVKLAENGAIAPADQPATGQMAGARFIIKASVTEFKEDVQSKAEGGGLKLAPLINIISIFVPVPSPASTVVNYADPTIGSASQTVQGLVGLDIRVTDVDTGTVVGSFRAAGTLTKTNTQRIFQLAGVSLNNADFGETVLGQATRVAVEDAVRKIHSALAERVRSEKSAVEIAATITGGGR